VRGVLAERTAEIGSMKRSMSVNNRARSNAERQLQNMQKQVVQLQKQVDQLQKQWDQDTKSYNGIKEANRARIDVLEKEIEVSSPLVTQIEETTTTVQDWVDRDCR
jgi:predicted  nucleic acid-binding Zn-ribbon protein